MPYKDPEKARARRAAYYQENKDKWVAAAARRKEQHRQSRQAQSKPLELAPKARQCLGCGADITALYRAKWGCKCSVCHSAEQKAYRAANSERIAASKKAWVEKNRERKAAQDRAYAQANPAARKQARAKWEAANPGATSAAKAVNKESRKQRVPTWLSEDDKWMVAQAYELAALRTRVFGFSWHVDHKIPLHGRRVSGLHVPTNLQVIPGVVNLRKGIQFEGLA